jgi:hypothetical protein
LAPRDRFGILSAMPGAPTTMQLDLFRAVEDVHDMTGAIVVLLTDYDGASVAVSGDEDVLPPAVRAVLSARQLEAAQNVIALLEPVAGELGALNLKVQAVGITHLLTIAFDAEADLDTVQKVGREAAAMIAEILGSGAN